MVCSDICLITALEIPGIPYFDMRIPKKAIRILTSVGLWKACTYINFVTKAAHLWILEIHDFYFFSGFISDQKTFQEKMKNSTYDIGIVGPGMAEPEERFKLNNLSFAGPVIMGVGGKESILHHPSRLAVISINGKLSGA